MLHLQLNMRIKDFLVSSLHFFRLQTALPGTFQEQKEPFSGGQLGIFDVLLLSLQ